MLNRRMLSKVPEVTVWFWVIKIQCTTVGESFADWVATTLGVGLHNTAAIFTAVLVAVLGWQMSLSRYVPFVYWLTVVVLSITGTLYTDILTDALGVPLAVSSAVFAAILAVVFGIWYARERTLSIHSITTTPREGFYWLAILVTFALGTAVGDWVLELTGWQPGAAVLLPAGLIAAIAAGWRLGANPVLAFWLAYILTRPLGANLGDWLARTRAEGGLGLGTAGTSVVFLLAIAATVAYLTITRADVIDTPETNPAAPQRDPGREKVMLGYFAALAVGSAALLGWASAQPHGASPALEKETPVTAAAELPAGSVAAAFPGADLREFRTIIDDTAAKVSAGDQSGAQARITDLEAAWDQAQSRLEPMNATAWTFLDSKIDKALKAVRAATPDPATEQQALGALAGALR
ncbi:MAG TPA: hypothetical protein PKK01_01715 [Mycobacterium sp.]|nr:hypothetical protein [Mycobacterium sp.]HPX38549.1 hypothetical protein [Mycobacterium sp.]HPZ96069.1 hypothetical protein [Mycobacterium sp.]HQC77644.1 hypothetical protein [Mycobacterium sp.]HQE14781.1 hypothetical protein [Mycobacterium sp.]